MAVLLAGDAPRALGVARACAVVVILLALIRIAGFLWGANPYLDQLLFGVEAVLEENRMAPNTALAFFLAGLALTFLEAEFGHGFGPTQVLTITTVLLAPVTEVGYSYSVAFLYQVSAFVRMGLHTALTFLVLGAGIVCTRLDRGLMAMVSSENASGKFQLEASEISIPGEPLMQFSLENPDNYFLLRKDAYRIAEDVGMPAEQVGKLALAIGEAASNAIKRGVAGRAAIFRTPERIIVRISDSGPGIRPDDLPATVLQAGFSTRVSRGMGYTLMLKLVDTVWLATSANGTVVQLEKWLHPEEHAIDPTLALLERSGAEPAMPTAPSRPV